MTWIVTGTSSFEPSGYVTTTVAGLLPSVLTSGVSFQVYFVPSGKSLLFLMPSAGFGNSPVLVFTSWPSGVYLSASVAGLVTWIVTGTSSFEPSGYVTTTVAGLSPAVVTSGVSFQVYLVPSGKSLLFLMPSAGSGTTPVLVFTSWPSGVYLSASVGFLVTVTVTGTSTVEPPG